jgi:L-2,4-diaminobutyrate decarboxylase
MGPAATPIELEVVAWMCGALGMSAGAGGLLTSGGSLGNLTALLAMRQARAGFDAWRQGAHGGPPLAVVTSDEAHYSVARTLRIMGWGDGGAIAAPVDGAHRLTAAAVRDALARAGERTVIGVIAAAGSTATGAFDPLDELAELCERRGLWLHVDAAHGGGLALTQYKDKLRGIERADSVVWDAHKLLMMPALVTAVLFKREADAYLAFAQKAPYLFDEGTAVPDLGQRTLECTKRAMAIEMWTALRVHGEQWFGDVVERQIALARMLADKVSASDDFELALAPEANIVCYRHRRADNRELRRRVVEDGRFYIVGTELGGTYWLRSTLMNPLIEERDLDALLAHLRSLCPA